jgi:2-alkyl-3-oxoalkanoate reductase
MENNESHTIGITGASGFIGRRMVEMGLARGYSMVVFVRPTSTYPKYWEGKVTIVKGDITSIDDLKPFVAKSNIIIHCAAFVADWGKKKLFKTINIDGTKNILDLLIGEEKKMVLASSVAVYSNKVKDCICTEDMVLPEPDCNYAWSKLEQEKLVKLYGKEHGIKFSIVRPGCVFGPNSRSYVKEYINTMKKCPVLISGGDKNALCYVDNVVDAFFLAALKSEANGQIYNATDDNTISWKEYANFIAGVLNLKKPRSIPKSVALALARILQMVYKLLNISRRPPLTVQTLKSASCTYNIPYTKAANELAYSPAIGKKEAFKRLDEYLKGEYLKMDPQE